MSRTTTRRDAFSPSLRRPEPTRLQKVAAAAGSALGSLAGEIVYQVDTHVIKPADHHMITELRNRQTAAKRIVWISETSVALQGAASYLRYRRSQTHTFATATIVPLAFTGLYVVRVNATPEAESGDQSVIRHPKGHVVFSYDEAKVVAAWALTGVALANYGEGADGAFGCSWRYDRDTDAETREVVHHFTLVWPGTDKPLSEIALTVHPGRAVIHIKPNFESGDNDVIDTYPTDGLGAALREATAGVELALGYIDSGRAPTHA